MAEKTIMPVKAWVERTSNLSSKADGVDDGTASLLCDACIALLKSFTPLLSQNFQDKADIVTFQEILIRLRLWRDGLGPGELEKVLTRSKTIQGSVLRHLIAISNLSRCGKFK